jgi:DNA-binding MarR family transcriptional regulator
MAEQSEPHALAEDVNWLLNRVWLGFGAARAEALDAVGLTVREQVLLSVLTTTDATQLELGRIAHMDKSVLTTTVDSLERKGLVVRVADPRDRRAKRPQLTEAGRTASDRGSAIAREAQERMLLKVPAEFRAPFVRVLHDLALGPFDSSPDFSQRS